MKPVRKLLFYAFVKWRIQNTSFGYDSADKLMRRYIKGGICALYITWRTYAVTKTLYLFALSLLDYYLITAFYVKINQDDFAV